MVRSGIRHIKKIHDKEYLYFMHYDRSGKRISKYCGVNGSIHAELVALKTELGNIIDMSEQLDRQADLIKKAIKKLNKK